MNKKYLAMVAFVIATVTALAQQHHAINPDFMDTSVRPQDDFYNYVNGNWMKTVEIPSDQSRWGSFNELAEHTNEATLKILKESLAQTYPKGSDGQKIADLYRSYTDFEARDKAGIEPIKPFLLKVDAIRDFNDLYQYLVKMAPIGGNPLFGVDVSAHMKNSDVNAVYLGAANLGLGRAYYQEDDEANAKTLANYQDYINILLPKAGQRTRDLKGPKIVAFEKELASHMLTVEEVRDASLHYNPVAVADLKNLVKNIDLAQYLADLGFKADTVIVDELKYYEELDRVLKPENLEAIKEFLRYKIVEGAATSLTRELDQISFDFWGKTLRGQKEQKSLDKRGLQFVNGVAGELLGKLYVAEYFPAEAKAAAEELVSYLRKSFAHRIGQLQWMSAETKEKALEKLSKFNVKIGYPDKWKDYSKLEVGTSLFENVLATRRWRFEKKLAEQDKPVDKTEWEMTPQTVNAYYNPPYNEIVFPAAILQPPFYDYKADPAVNFGGIGAVIGHELSHGFDDSGSQYDGEGNLNNWWTEADKTKFETATAALAAQFEAYEPVPGVFVNGRFTLGENIGDLGGVSVAYNALQMYLKDKGNPGKIDGFTQQQRFFLSWATVWRTKTTEAFVVNQVKTDPHSPAEYRAIGPLVNMDAFYEAFDIKKGDKLFVPKDKRIVIW
ncbi:M13 family metallopeptidase [Parapedobacter indicus]|uniref:Putative endopeptidase n=1 Tax=Parapedobacter indicus TaxID=1477437 RepID=A0A1I3VA53_9SPHI|nr:M13 family metallopeptidase [Parapedobacter indicus]PPK98954.1 putative endopeptidase [Parapedobacter indicus]SFJ91889.1 putative endopeptidase [Parapedobacter indicus]